MNLTERDTKNKSSVWLANNTSLSWHVLSNNWDGWLFGHNRHGPYRGGGLLCPCREELGPHLTQCGLGCSNWHLDPSNCLTITDRKVGVLCPLVGGAGSPSNTMYPGPRSTSLPSSILIHSAVWPQQTWAKNWGSCAPLREGVGPHTNETISAASGPKFTVLLGHVEEILLLN